jgi:hypothetical protein
MTNFRTAALAIAATLAMMSTQAQAADSQLAPGKPAGVREAVRHGPNLLLIGGVGAAVVAGIVIATTNSGNSSCSAANCPGTTTATTTTS